MSGATTVLHAINFQNVLFISIVHDYLSKATPDISLHLQWYLILVQNSFYLLFKQYEAKKLKSMNLWAGLENFCLIRAFARLVN